jgi:hypothetical protein
MHHTPANKIKIHYDCYSKLNDITIITPVNEKAKLSQHIKLFRLQKCKWPMAYIGSKPIEFLLLDYLSVLLLA